MESQFGAILQIQSSRDEQSHELQQLPTAPQKAVERTYHSVPTRPSSIEIDRSQWGATHNGTHHSSDTTTPNTQAFQSANNLEMSRPSTPVQESEAVEARQGLFDPPMNKWRMLSVCLMNFSGGLNDSAPGALLPYIESHYDIGYAVVSLIFVTSAAGFVSAAFIVEPTAARLGRARTLMLACLMMVIGYVPITCAPPFPVVVACFFLLGCGMALNLALGNVFAVNLQNGTTMLGAMHGSYGLGGTLGPLIATSMVTSGHLNWSLYYLIPLGMTVFNGFFVGWSFWNYEKEHELTNESNLMTSPERIASRVENRTATAEQPSKFSGMAKSFKSKPVILGALFIFAYQGAEVSISGWVISFLIATRQGNPNAIGYVTSGFWAGITLGRFLLSHPAHRIGEKRFVYGMVIGATVFQLLVWFVPNVIGDSVALALVGLLLGPVYPCSAVVFSRLIPRQDQVAGMSVISAFGSSGGALAPFMTGLLAQVVGTWVLHPIAIGLFAVMMVCWFVLPKAAKRTV